VVFATFTPDEYRTSFTGWMQKYQKAYAHDEFAFRFNIFKQNMDFVTKHNSEDHTYQVGLNEYADLTSAEFLNRYTGLFHVSQPSKLNMVQHLNVDIPASADWRQKGAVTGIKNQGQCGSCWSFSATGSIEGQHMINTGNLVSFSEQNLVDCSGAQGNEGCDGGLMDYAFQYVITTKGLDTEASYPYEAVDDTCRYNAANSGGFITGFKDIPSGDETALTTSIATVGPISVAIDASNPSFQLYTSGVYYEPNCSSTQLDHGVLAVGYDQTSDGTAYYIVKNSWGTGWGQAGYIWMSRNKSNNCGIATASSYPTGAQ